MNRLSKEDCRRMGRNVLPVGKYFTFSDAITSLTSVYDISPRQAENILKNTPRITKPYKGVYFIPGLDWPIDPVAMAQKPQDDLVPEMPSDRMINYLATIGISDYKQTSAVAFQFDEKETISDDLESMADTELFGLIRTASDVLKGRGWAIPPIVVAKEL